ncbi:MAG: methyltransferase domain-containing protein [Acetivibrionales bacterium]
MDKEILNMEEASELFGVSIKTFIKLLKEEKVPARKIGREWRFSKKALIDWLSSGDSQAYSSSETETRDFFNKVAPRWEEISREYFDESVKNKLISLNILESDMTVMDLGAGDGLLSRAVAEYVKKVISVDISSEMLKELKRKADISGIKNIETLESDGQDLPVKDSSIDAVLAGMYLHHIEDPELAVREMYRVLKPGGIAFLADFYQHSNKELKENMHDVWAGFNPEEVRIWFERCGFKNVSIEAALNGKEEKKYRKLEDIFVLTAEK